jgi:hypothetical protein
MRIILLILVLAICDARSQIEFTFQTDFPLFDTEILEDIAFFTERNADVPLKRTDNFPIRPAFRAGVSLMLDNDVYLGAFGFYHSTGFSLHYSDYSGEVRSNLIFNHFGFGLSILKKIHITENFYVGLGADLAILMKEYKFSDEIVVFEESSTQDDIIEESLGFIILNIQAAYTINNFSFGGNLGYGFDGVESSFRDPDPDNLMSVTALRPGIFISYKFDIFSK